MQARFKRFTALILSVLMVLTCMPMSAMAEDAVIPAEDISVEVIPEDAEAVPEQDTATVMDAEASEPESDPVSKTVQETEVLANQASAEETPSAPETVPETETPQEEVPQEEPAAQSEETQPAEATEEPMPVEEIPVEEPAAEAPVETEQEAEKPAPDDRHPLKAAIDSYGHIYVATVRQTDVFGNAKLDADTLVFSTTNDVFLLLATKFTDEETVKVWFMDSDGNVVSGFVSVKNLDEKYLLDKDIKDVSFLPVAQGETAIGMMSLFLVNGSYPAAETDPQIVEQPVDTLSEEEEPVSTVAEEHVESELEETELPAETAEDEPQPETDPAEQPAAEEKTFADEPQETMQEEPAEDPETTENPEASAETPEDHPAEPEVPQEEAPEVPDEPAYEAAGSYIAVTTKTRVFAGIDAQAAETYYSGEYLGNFVKDATVQILTVDFDETGHVWYQVRFLYGDDFKDGTMKWTDYATCWILLDETSQSESDSCTVTDFAYTHEFVRSNRTGVRRRLKATTPMDGFSLMNINGPIGAFYFAQSSLFGSSGKDAAYPQVAKSPSHGNVYATPHFLEGYPVFCLEHNLSGPGEGSGTSQSPTGPYVLIDMEAFVNNPAFGGTTGVRYKESTMHAIAWVLRHTYPFMALNRSDVNNEVWSRVAGQYAIREVIKRLEGPQYVRSFWDMDSFYSFDGGAPAVYLAYARWLADNGVAHAYISGHITVSNQRLIASGNEYIGHMELLTDADLIRIPKSVGTISGHTGGADSQYYYAKSGDSIQIISSQSEFTVTMESMSSGNEEARFLVAVALANIQKLLVPVHGEPYILRQGSVTFSLGLGEMIIIKQSTDGNMLKGAVFELINSSGQVIAAEASDAEGVVIFSGLQPDDYTVREITAPQGFKLANGSSQNISIAAGDSKKVVFIDPPVTGRIRIVKTDASTHKSLAGAVFAVTRLTGPDSYDAPDIGMIVATITTTDQGIAETGLLPWGEYRIEEIGVPDGYIDCGYSTTISIQ